MYGVTFYACFEAISRPSSKLLCFINDCDYLQLIKLLLFLPMSLYYNQIFLQYFQLGGGHTIQRERERGALIIFTISEIEFDHQNSLKSDDCEMPYK